jgi:FkbM family methyltransferase
MLCNRNPNPLFAKFVCYNNLLTARPICLIDVGAWGGPQPLWQPLLGCVKFIGFDFNEQECNRLNAGYRQQNLDITFYPYAIYDSATKKKFYVTKFPPSSGFIPGNQNFLGRFLSIVSDNLEIVQEFETETINIDSFVKKEHIDYVDFIKVDVEGVEFSVLKGAQKCLAGVLGVETELNIGPLRDPENFSNIDTLLRIYGFHLFDINIARYPRKTLPRGYLSYEQDRFKIDWPQKYGQILSGDAVYLRDPIFERNNGLKYFEWNDVNVLKMASLYELYMLQDCAIELLQEYQSNFSSDLPFNHFYELLTPLVNGFGRVGYEDYIQVSNSLPWPEMEMYQRHWIK